jgi:sugar/nucleoside kinase (ribokinase family)
VVVVADTLGAGDVFCGALMHAIAAQPVADDESFGAARQFAAGVTQPRLDELMAGAAGDTALSPPPPAWKPLT